MAEDGRAGGVWARRGCARRLLQGLEEALARRREEERKGAGDAAAAVVLRCLDAAAPTPAGLHPRRPRAPRTGSAERAPPAPLLSSSLR